MTEIKIIDKSLPILAKNKNLLLLNAHRILWITLQIANLCIKYIEKLYRRIYYATLLFIKKTWRGKTHLQSYAIDSSVLKQPQHISFIIMDENNPILDIANLVVWSYFLGSEFVTIHTYREFSTNQLQDLYRECISKLSNESTKPMCNIREGILNENLFFSSLHSGRQNIVDVARHASQLVQSNANQLDSISKEWIEKAFKTYNKNGVPVPDPQLTIVIGPITTLHGFQIWQSRLSEILHLNSIKINYEEFVETIKLYSSCQQRFGK